MSYLKGIKAASGFILAAGEYKMTLAQTGLTTPTAAKDFANVLPSVNTSSVPLIMSLFTPDSRANRLHVVLSLRQVTLRGVPVQLPAVPAGCERLPEGELRCLSAGVHRDHR